MFCRVDLPCVSAIPQLWKPVFSHRLQLAFADDKCIEIGSFEVSFVHHWKINLQKLHYSHSMALSVAAYCDYSFKMKSAPITLGANFCAGYIQVNNPWLWLLSGTALKLQVVEWPRPRLYPPSTNKTITTTKSNCGSCPETKWLFAGLHYRWLCRESSVQFQQNNLELTRHIFSLTMYGINLVSHLLLYFPS